MTDFADVVDDTDLLRLYRHWRGLAGGGVPLRARFDPFALPAIMPHLFMMDVLPDRRFRYRLVGTALDAHLGRPFTGRHLDEMRQGRTRDDLALLFDTAARERIPGYYISRLATETQPLATYRRLVLPLAAEDGAVGVLLGGFKVEWTTRDAQRGDFAFERRAERDGQLTFGAPSGA